MSGGFVFAPLFFLQLLVETVNKFSIWTTAVELRSKNCNGIPLIRIYCVRPIIILADMCVCGSDERENREIPICWLPLVTLTHTNTRCVCPHTHTYSNELYSAAAIKMNEKSHIAVVKRHKHLHAIWWFYVESSCQVCCCCFLNLQSTQVAD